MAFPDGDRFNPFAPTTEGRAQFAECWEKALYSGLEVKFPKGMHYQSQLEMRAAHIEAIYYAIGGTADEERSGVMSDNNEALAEQLAAKHYKAMCAKELGHLSTIDTIASAIREALNSRAAESSGEAVAIVGYDERDEICVEFLKGDSVPAVCVGDKLFLHSAPPATDERAKALVALLEKVSWEVREYAEGFTLLWDEVDAALAASKEETP